MGIVNVIIIILLIKQHETTVHAYFAKQNHFIAIHSSFHSLIIAQTHANDG